MKIVIELDSELYSFIKEKRLMVMDVGEVGNAIKDGIVLPEGHGDLIDKDQFEQLLRHFGLDYEADTFIPKATTVIEADK